MCGSTFTPLLSSGTPAEPQRCQLQHQQIQFKAAVALETQVRASSGLNRRRRRTTAATVAGTRRAL